MKRSLSYRESYAHDEQTRARQTNKKDKERKNNQTNVKVVVYVRDARLRISLRRCIEFVSAGIERREERNNGLIKRCSNVGIYLLAVGIVDWFTVKANGQESSVKYLTVVIVCVESNVGRFKPRAVSARTRYRRVYLTVHATTHTLTRLAERTKATINRGDIYFTSRCTLNLVFNPLQKNSFDGSFLFFIIDFFISFSPFLWLCVRSRLRMISRTFVQLHHTVTVGLHCFETVFFFVFFLFDILYRIAGIIGLLYIGQCEKTIEWTIKI